MSAFADTIFPRTGIAFVDTTRLDNTVTVEQAEAKRVALPPSLSIEGIRQSISFALLTPAWLPRASSP